MEKFLLEGKNSKLGWVPVDMNDAAVTGLRIDMRGSKRATFIVQMGASTAAIVTLALKQHDAATSGTSKALLVENPYYVKAGAATVFTKTTPASATDTYDLSTTFAAVSGIVVFEVLAEDLDVEGNFAWVSLSALDSTAAKLSSCIVLTSSFQAPSYAQAL